MRLLRLVVRGLLACVPCYFLSFLALTVSDRAQGDAPLPAQNTSPAAQEKQWQSRDGGYYAGPREGRRNYRLDKCPWAVTPEFAKRICMPASTVSEEPKGAEDAAFRRISKVIINSWVSREAYDASDFFFVAEEKLSVSDNKAYQSYARSDLVRLFSETLPNTEAVVQQWQVDLLKGKFGVDESKWATESQWSRSQSPAEQQRSQLQTALSQAQGAFKTTGEVIAATPAETAAKAKAQASAQTRLDPAQAALDTFNGQHPIDPQQAAWIVDYSGVSGNADAMKAAREGAAQQWMKVIALDWNGDGIISRITPSAAAKTDLKSIQTDGLARFDVDSDGGGFITNASELFNGAFTAFARTNLSANASALLLAA